MLALRHDPDTCKECPSPRCLLDCQYMDMKEEEAREEILKLTRGEDSRVLEDCMTCYGCEEYCPYGNHPFFLICEMREKKGMYVAPRPITNQWINMTQMQGKALVGKVKDVALSSCLLPSLGTMASGEIFAGLSSSIVFGAEFMCPAVHTHFAKMSVVRERLHIVLGNFQKLGVRELICLHDECYGTFTSLARAYGMEVPFEPVYYMDFLLRRLAELQEKLRPLEVEVVYQRPCSNRWIPRKHAVVKRLFDMLGARLLERTYQDENSLCCGGILRLIGGYKLSDDVQRRNIEDMARTGAEYCVFDCPACQETLGPKVAKAGLKPIHMIDLCKMALGEIPKGEV
jgi:Fe-S oxidoreductase